MSACVYECTLKVHRKHLLLCSLFGYFLLGLRTGRILNQNSSAGTSGTGDQGSERVLEGNREAAAAAAGGWRRSMCCTVSSPRGIHCSEALPLRGKTGKVRSGRQAKGNCDIWGKSCLHPKDIGLYNDWLQHQCRDFYFVLVIQVGRLMKSIRICRASRCVSMCWGR